MVIAVNFSKRMEGLSSAIFSVLENKRNELLTRGMEVFNLSVGTPDLPPAPHVMEAFQEASREPDNYKYALKDMPQLVDTVVQWYESRYGVKLEQDEVLGMMGSQDGLAHIALTLVDPGETVLVPDPGYPIFSVGPAIACANIERVPLDREKGYLIDFDAIPPSTAHAAKLMVVSYPNNPVTAFAPPEFYERLVWFAKKYGIAVLHDNAYSELVFDGRKGGSFLSIPGAKEVGVEFNSLSKSYNLTGCRISFALGNRDMIRQLRILKSHLDYGVFLPVQRAAIAALTGPQDGLAATVRAYESRRNVLVEGFREIGWHMEKPPATMFVWAPIPPNYSSSEEFTLALLEKTGVIVVPGSSFGERGEGFVRMALVQSEESLAKAVNVIRASGIFR